LTLFAPNNDAFDRLSEETFNQLSLLLSDDNFLPQLVDLLLNHVTAGEFLLIDLERIVQAFPGAPLLADDGVGALNGEFILVDFPPLRVNGVKFVDGDNIRSNGVVHITELVLLPPSIIYSLADRIAGACFCFEGPELTTFLSLLVLADIDLSGPSALTVVGPTDDAFALLSPAAVAFLTSPEGFTDLTRILNYHVLVGIRTSTSLIDGFVRTLDSSLVEVRTTPALMFNEANAVEVDILANNGVLHKIDRVLFPDDLE
jgi:uncharacterized surface protein with fasciclin (FAS1) repeats